MNIVSTEGLTKSYRRHRVVDGLQLQIPEGSAYGLIGANGAGKTTTIKMLLNIIAPDAGKAHVLDVDTRRLGPQQLARIGYVSENQELPLGLTCQQFVDYVRPMYPTWDADLEKELRKQLALPMDSKIRSLSHGTRIKLALLCALTYRPKLLILDEPLGGLDPLARDEFLEGMLRQAGETTVLMSSHELAEIESTLTHVAYLNDGKLVFSEPLSDLNQRFREIRVTMDAPPPASQPLLGYRVQGNTVRYVETQFDEAKLGEAVRARFTSVRDIQAAPMGLRDIFVALARESQNRGKVAAA